MRPSRRRTYGKRYDEIMQLGMDEYRKRPAAKALPQGPKLLKALCLQKKSILSPASSLDSARPHRTGLFKRKQHRCATFQSEAGTTAAYDFLSALTTDCLQRRNVFTKQTGVFAGSVPSFASDMAASFQPYEPMRICPVTI